MLAAAVRSNLTKLLHDILDLMFAYGLSEHLRQCLSHISGHIPPLLGAIQGKWTSIHIVLYYVPTKRGEFRTERLLDSISLALVGQNYRPSGGPFGVRSEQLLINRDLVSIQVCTVL